MQSLIALVLLATVCQADFSRKGDPIYPWFTPGILTGVLTALLFLVILSIGICCIMDINPDVPVLPKQKKA
jgi:hypothetical protein